MKYHGEPVAARLTPFWPMSRVKQRAMITKVFQHTAALARVMGYLPTGKELSPPLPDDAPDELWAMDRRASEWMFQDMQARGIN